MNIKYCNVFCTNLKPFSDLYFVTLPKKKNYLTRKNNKLNSTK